MKPESIKSVLIIKPGAIGDLLQITPTIRAIKKHLPEARITVMVGIDGTIPLFTHNPHVSEVLAYDRKGRHKSIAAFLRLLWEIATTRYDVVINFQRSSLGTWLITLAAMPLKVLVYHKTRTRRVHAVLNHLETVRSLGIDTGNVNLDLELYIPAEDVQLAGKLLQDAGLAEKALVARTSSQN